MKTQPLRSHAIKHLAGAVSACLCLIGTSALANTAAYTLAPASQQLAAQSPCGTSAIAPLNQVAMSKSAAILGGAPSSLELIRQQQSFSQTPDATSASAQLAVGADAPHAALTPAAGGHRLNGNCNGVAAAAPASQSFATPATSRYSSEDFLASKRVAIGRTMFDSDWARVQHDRLPKAALAQATQRSGGDRLQMISDVNRWANRSIRFVDDSKLFGRADYWAGASKTLSLRKGDCEDIALVKMQMLAAAGIPASDMTLTIARDLVRKADHALLIVKHEGRYLMLDNSTEDVLDASNSNDYRPVLSFSANQKWIHGY